MTIPVWEFGNIRAEGFSEQHQTGYIQNTPDAGKQFRRQMFTDISNIISFNLLVSHNKYYEFKHFFITTLQQGTIPFYMYDCRIGLDRLARFIDTTAPQGSYQGGYYNIPLTIMFDPIMLEVNYPMLSEDAFMLLSEDGYPLLLSDEWQV